MITDSCCSQAFIHTDLCNFTQPLEVILPLWSHETVEGEGGKVADCHLSVKVKNKTHSQNTLAPNCLKFVMVHLCVQLALWLKHWCIKDVRLGSHLIWAGVLDDLSAKITALDGTQILENRERTWQSIPVTFDSRMVSHILLCEARYIKVTNRTPGWYYISKYSS